MKSTRRDSPLWQRILLAVTVALAVVGMHHLTSLGCTEPAAHHGVVSMAYAGPDSDSPLDELVSNAALDDMSPGLTCLALLIAVGVAFRAIGGVIARRRDQLQPTQEASVKSRIADPPDLHFLSISRT